MKIRKIFLKMGFILSVMTLMMSGCKKEDNISDKTEETTSQEVASEEIVSEEITSEEITTGEITSDENAGNLNVDYQQLYSDILKQDYDYIISPTDDYTEGQIGIAEVAHFYSATEALDSIGYTIMDISGDDIPELIVAGIMNESTAPSPIYQIYTTDGENTYFVLSGWSRSIWYLKEDFKTLYSYGSSGAAYSNFGLANLSEDGRTVCWQDFYFTTPEGDTFDLIYYHNKTGEFACDNSEKLEFENSEDFWSIDDEFYEGVTLLDLTPFSEMSGENE